MKIRPAELAPCLVQPQAGGLPCDWPGLFGRRGPLCVEVGFGNGEYLAWWAGQEPETDFVGLEVPFGCIARAARRLAREERPNVRLVQGDGRYLLRELFATGSLRKVLMQFPMPWPKGRHAKHRVAGTRFAATLADVLAPGGELELLTDQDWYAADARAALARSGSFELSEGEVDPVRPFRTRYEKKWLEDGRNIHRLRAFLRKPQPANRLCLPLPMLTILLQPFPTAERVHVLLGARFGQAGCVAEVKESWSNEDGFLLRVVAADDSFSQMFHLEIARRRNGSGLLRVAECPRPYYTPAVRMLVEAAGRALSPVAAS